MDKWNVDHKEEIEKFVSDQRKIYKANLFYNIEHTIRKIRPHDQFILQYYKYVFKYTVGKNIDTVTVEHYKRSTF